MSLFVDTSVWSLALRRDAPQNQPEVQALDRALRSGQPVVSTGLVLQKLLQGFAAPESRAEIVQRFAALPMIVPDSIDYIEAAELRTACRRRGVQVGTINALIAQLCIRRGLTLLTTDGDFAGIAANSALLIWYG